MDSAMGVVTYGLGTLLGLVLVAVLVFWFIQDVTQKKHTILRNFPVVGRLRYLFERQGEYFRQYFFANDREEMPFNRSVRSWVYRLAKDEGGTIGFGGGGTDGTAGLITVVDGATGGSTVTGGGSGAGGRTGVTGSATTGGAFGAVGAATADAAAAGCGATPSFFSCAS
jgi:hypothetical protein